MRLVGFLMFLAISGFALWVRKLVLKRRLEKGLGRKVQDSELLSITEWREATPAEDNRVNGEKKV
ncbi:MAG TPA: hypothetical protein VGO91_09295 [Pyrinomonadaceae bacterium]|jgi:hypothetical protein|nr:hypothetical protein [Pyrinomonadaceae bacterium]